MISKDIIDAINELAPLYLQEKWDNSGLQIGSYKRQIKSILLVIDLNQYVIKEAIDNEIDMIITHHPLFFKDLKNINEDTYKGKMIYELIKNDIVVYSAHTNLDSTIGGVSDALAKVLNIQNIKVLKKEHIEKLYKLVVYVPSEYSDKVREVITNEGAGWIGNYSHCTFNTEGIGTFMPRENTKPFIGEYEKLENVKEVRIETIVKQYSLNKVLKEMIKAHPYEEVSYDIYPLENEGKVYGLGRIGELEEEITLEKFSKVVKKALNCDNIRVYGNINKTIKKVAVCGGSGSSFIKDAFKNNADVYITGDIKHHDAQEALEFGICLIDANHYHTEKVILKELKNTLENKFCEEELRIKISQHDNSGEFNIF